jgi:putative flippase GtrA
MEEIVTARALLMSARLRIVRYGVIGASMSLIYAVLTAAFMEATSWTGLQASMAAFCVSLPFAYLAHRHVTFASTGQALPQFFRFAATMTNAFVVSSISMLAIVDVLGWHYVYALAVTTVSVALINYVVFSKWVFAAQHSSGRD